MEKLSAFIVKHKFLILAIMLLITIVSLVCMFLFVKVNSDILSYLPDGEKMTEGMNVMKKTFDMQGDAIIGVTGVDFNEMEKIVQKISLEEGIKPGGVIWIGMFEEMRAMDIAGMLDGMSFEGMPSSFQTIFKAKLKQYEEQFKDFDANAFVDNLLKDESLLAIFYPDYEKGVGLEKDKEATYLVMLQLNVPTSSDEAMDLVKKIDDVILKDYDHAIGGSTKLTQDIFDSTIGEIWKYVIVAVLAMFVILLLTTNSLVEPFIFMITLGVSILINMGTNAILPSVSVVTFSSASILQLGLSMDYAIFLMHAYSEERQKTLDNNLAMRRAIPRTFSTITASALTTIGGFIALFFMKFTIGADLGIVLAKGVFLSLLTVLFLQPVLILFTSKLHDKTSHRLYLPKFRKLASFSVTHRKTIVIIALILLIPSMIMQQFVDLSYIQFVEPKQNKTHVEQVVDRMSNTIIVIVPATGKDKNNNFVEEIKKVDNVVGIMGAYSMFPEEMHGLLADIALGSSMMDLGSQLPPEGAALTGFINNGKTMYSIMIDCEAESEEATIALGKVTALLDKYFMDSSGNEQYNITGMAQAVSDLRGITPTDFLIVNIASILIILLVLWITLKSFRLSTILIAVIELGIFINLSICFIFGQTINFMAYIIISSIQLGSTVDYAILYAVKYQHNLDYMPAKEAAYKALQESGASIMTSVAIMVGCTLSVSLITTNTIVAEITNMIARGSIISGTLVFVLLPALMVTFTGNKRLKRKTRVQSKVFKKTTKKADKELIESQS